MSFLKNAWYCAGWARDLTDAPRHVKIIGQDVALYRDSSGKAIALANRCPHRFAPLSDGKVVGDTLECPYHGLQFDHTGACVLNPHGRGIVPPRARVDAYVLVEQHSTLWIWLGDPAKADPSTILDLSYLDDPRYAVATGCVHINANYQLLNDNLLDLTHVSYIHTTTVGLPPEHFIGEENMHHSVKINGDVVDSNYIFNKVPPTPQLSRYFKDQFGDFYAYLRWQAPSSMLLDLSMSPLGSPKGETTDPTGPQLLHPVAHLIVPETEDSCHYFYAMARNIDIDDEESTKHMGDMGEYTFSVEDGKIAEKCYELMAGIDFFDLEPAILETDRAGIAARRIVAQLISRESRAEVAADHGPSVPKLVSVSEDAFVS